MEEEQNKIKAKVLCTNEIKSVYSQDFTHLKGRIIKPEIDTQKEEEIEEEEE